MLVKITGENKMYTTKRYKRAHSVLNLKVLRMWLTRGKIFENAPVISTSIHRCVNNFPDIKVLVMVIETKMFNVDFIHHNKFTDLDCFSVFFTYIIHIHTPVYSHIKSTNLTISLEKGFGILIWGTGLSL